MDSRWLDHIDAHIAAGQVAAEAESAELLSWLLKLEPEQRWCLVLSRDKRLERLSAADYRRLVSLMVELEPKALADAPQPPLPCLSDLTLLPAPEIMSEMVPTGRRPRLPLLLALAAVGVLGALWAISPDGETRLATLGRKVAVWGASVAGGKERLADIDDRVNRESRTTERLQRLVTARTALEALERKLTTAESFATELVALKRVWPRPEQLAPLEDASAGGRVTPESLRADLVRLQQGLKSERTDLVSEARLGRIDANVYYARMAALSTLENQVAAALTAASKDDWSGAGRALETVEEPDYETWREQVASWLELRALVSDLSLQLWLQWLEGLPQEPAAEVQ